MPSLRACPPLLFPGGFIKVFAAVLAAGHIELSSSAFFIPDPLWISARLPASDDFRAFFLPFDILSINTAGRRLRMQIAFYMAHSYIYLSGPTGLDCRISNVIMASKAWEFVQRSHESTGLVKRCGRIFSSNQQTGEKWSSRLGHRVNKSS